MKPSKSPENAEVTPSKKKLKQARLPFKLISEVSSTPVTPPTRKRKLSAADVETVPKIGKLSKENDLSENAVVISDDDSNNADQPIEQGKSLNPFVKLVDTAWKKKLQKNKKKKNDKKSKNVVNGSTDTVTNGVETAETKNEVETMDVDEPVPAEEASSNKEAEQNVEVTQKVTPKTKKATPKRKSARKSKASPRSTPKSSNKSPVSVSHDVVVVEDSSDKPEVISNDGIITDKEEQTGEVEETQVNTELTTASEKTISKEEQNKIENVIPSAPDTDNKETSEKEKSTVENEENDKVKDVQTNEENKTPANITPKRSSRNKSKVEEKEKTLNKSISKLDESVSSNPSTPKHNRSLSVTTSLDESLNESTASANLTPKQVIVLFNTFIVSLGKYYIVTSS